MLRRDLVRLAWVFAFFVLFAIWAVAHAEVGYATWYEYGAYTTSGERFYPDGQTCAHPAFRAGMRLWYVRVTVLATGRSAQCRVNDRGPADWTHNKIDVSRGVARRLGILRAGRVKVRIDHLR